MRGAATSGPRAANKAFGVARGADTSRPVFSRAEAAQMANGQFNRQALAYIGGEGLCYGRADLRAGTVVNIEGAGKTFSGRYYVTSTTHRLTPDQRYRTSFSYQRNAT
jgi:phage protein D